MYRFLSAHETMVIFFPLSLLTVHIVSLTVFVSQVLSTQSLHSFFPPIYVIKYPVT